MLAIGNTPRVTRQIGYGRSAAADERDEERRRLIAAGCDPVYLENGAAKAMASRSRGKAVRTLSPGDVLVVTRIDRLGLSLIEIIAVLQRVFDLGANIKALDDAIDTARDPAARIALEAMISAQSRLVSERAKTSLATLRAEGKRLGPPVKLQPEQWPEVKAMLDAKVSAAEMTARFNVSRQTLWNFRQRMEAGGAQAQSSETSEKS